MYGPNDCRISIEQGKYEPVITYLRLLKEDETYPMWDHIGIIYVIRYTILKTKNKSFIDKILEIIDYEYKFIQDIVRDSDLSTIKFVSKNYPDLMKLEIRNDLLYKIITNHNYNYNNKHVSYSIINAYDSLEDKLNSNLYKIKYFITNFVFNLEDIGRMISDIPYGCGSKSAKYFQEIWECVMSNLHMIKPANLSIRHNKIKEFINKTFDKITLKGNIRIMKYLVSKYRGIIKINSYEYAYDSRNLEVIKYVMTFTPKHKIPISRYLEYFNEYHDRELFRFALQRSNDRSSLMGLVNSNSFSAHYKFSANYTECIEEIDMVLNKLLNYITPNELYKRFYKKIEVIDFLMRHKYIQRFEPPKFILIPPAFSYLYYLGYYYNIEYELNMPIYERKEFKRQFISAAGKLISTRMLEGFMSIYPNAIAKMHKPYDITKRLKYIIRYCQLILMSNWCYKLEFKIRMIKNRLGLNSGTQYYHKLILQYELPRTTFEHVVNVNDLIPQSMAIKRWKTGFRHMMNFDENFLNFT